MKCQDCTTDVNTKGRNWAKHRCEICQKKHLSILNVDRVKKWRIKNNPKCGLCNAQVKRPDAILCAACSHVNQIEKTKTLTLQEFYSRPSISGKHPSWKAVHIRALARYWTIKTHKICQVCGYNIEVAHKRAINTFPETATVGEVNAPENLLTLCPNCHWEFDHGLLVGA